MAKTKIDYLRLRTQSTFAEVFKAVRPAFYGAGELLELGPSIQGKDGWESRRDLTFAGEYVGAIDYGGQSQRGWVRLDLSGKGCAWVDDWSLVEGLRTALDACELRRVDVCLDTFDGSVTHERVLEAYEAGLFKRPEGGRNPKMKKVESSCPTDGRTVYVGARTSPRFIRCYEKGWEQVAKMGIPSQFVAMPSLRVAFDGVGGEVRPDDFYRVEIEFKAVDGVVLPWPMITSRDEYFAGAAVFCSQLVEAAPRRLQAMPSELMPKAVLASQMEHARRAYGGLFRALTAIYGDDVETKARLFDEMSANSPSDRLVREGVLTIDG